MWVIISPICSLVAVRASTMPDTLPQKGKVEVLFENRTLPLRDGVFTDHFEPYTRHIYRIRR